MKEELIDELSREYVGMLKKFYLIFIVVFFLLIVFYN